MRGGGRRRVTGGVAVVAVAALITALLSVAEPSSRAAAAGAPVRGGALSSSVTAVPSAPFVESVAAEGLGVLVGWDPDPAGDQVKSYSVTATPASGSSTTSCPKPAAVTVSVSGSDTGVVVGGLCAAVIYTVKVVAVSSAGSSAPSSVSAPLVPLVAQVPDVPLLVSETGRTGEALVDWAAPVYDGGDPLTGYTLVAKHSTKVVKVSAPAGALSATVSGLSDGTTYSLSLTASNAVGESKAASGSATPSGVYLPSAPVGLTALPNGAGAVVVSWQPPSDDGGGAVSGYTISYQQQQQSKIGVWSAVAGAPVETLAEASSATSATVTSFPASPAFFLFSITASNSAGTGSAAVATAPVSPTTTAKSTTVVLSASSVTALVSVTATTLVWDDPPPAQVSSIALGDVVTCNPGGLVPDGMLREVTAISDSSGVYTLTTSQASLSQAVTNMSLASTVQTGTASTGSGSLNKSSAGSSSPPGAGQAVFVPKMAGVVMHHVGPDGTVSKATTWSVDLSAGPVAVAAQFGMTAQIGMDINVRTGFLDIPDGVSISASAKAIFSLEDSITVSGTLGGKDDPFETEIGELDLEPIPADVVIPTVIVPKIPVYLDITGSVSLGYEATMTVGASLTWTSSDPGHLAVKNLSKGPALTGGPIPGLTYSGTLFAGVSIVPQLDIDDAAGPDFEADVGIQAQINPDPSPGQYFFELGPALNLSAGLAFDLFGLHGQANYKFSQFTYAGFTISKAPVPSYTVTPADPSIPLGKSVTFKAARSDGKTVPVTWSLLGATRADTITTGGKLTVAAPTGRTLTVEVKDSSGASGETTVTVGTPFYPPSDLGAQQGPSEPVTEDLSWTAPAKTGGYPIAHYVVITEPATTTQSVTATAATLSGLTAGTYVADVYAIDTEGITSPPASTLFTIDSESTGNPGWTPTEAPLPANAASNPDVDLESVECPATGTCIAVGYDNYSAGQSQGLIETLSGGTWTLTEPPLPANAASPPYETLGSVECPAAGTCIAVGQYDDTSGNSQGLIETLSGGTWTATEAPLAANAASDPKVDLESVECPAAGSCAVVGVYYDTSGYQQGLIETLSGGTWSAIEAPLPDNAASDPNQEVSLNSLACPATGSCAVVGVYYDTSGHGQGLIETLSGGTWTSSEAPVPGNYANGSLGSVVCPASGTCTAVGFVSEPNGYLQGLIEALSGGTWTATEAPLPANAASQANAALVSVACPAAGTCAAVGSYIDTSGNAQGLIEALSGGTWTVTEAPLPANAGGSQDVSLRSVVCPAAGTCAAVGSYYDTSEYEQGLIETLSGGNWTATEAPLPANANSNPSAFLGSVACPAAGSCAAVGSYNDYGQGLIETQQ